MSSRFYVSKQRGSWHGVVEVPDGQTRFYYYHVDWPQRNYFEMPFHDDVPLADCIDPDRGWWVPLLDEDLWMDEGL